MMRAKHVEMRILKPETSMWSKKGIRNIVTLLLLVDMLNKKNGYRYFEARYVQKIAQRTPTMPDLEAGMVRAMQCMDKDWMLKKLRMDSI